MLYMHCHVSTWIGKVSHRGNKHFPCECVRGKDRPRDPGLGKDTLPTLRAAVCSLHTRTHTHTSPVLLARSALARITASASSFNTKLQLIIDSRSLEPDLWVHSFFTRPRIKYHESPARSLFSGLCTHGRYYREKHIWPPLNIRPRMFLLPLCLLSCADRVPNLFHFFLPKQADTVLVCQIHSRGTLWGYFNHRLSQDQLWTPNFELHRISSSRVHSSTTTLSKFNIICFPAVKQMLCVFCHVPGLMITLSLLSRH